MSRGIAVVRRLAAFSISLVLLLSLGLPVSATPAIPAASPGTPPVAQANAIQQRLLAGTKRLEATQQHLQATLRAVRQARWEQAKARQEVAAATAAVNAFAATAYRESPVSGLSLLIQLSGQDPHDALTAAGYLDRAGDYRSEVLTRVRGAEARAARAGVAAEQARRLAVDTQRHVLRQVADLQSAAASASATLSGPGTASRAVIRRPLAATDLASLAAAGYPNGLIPASALCPAGPPTHVLRCDAAAGFRSLVTAYARAFHRSICVTDSYRSYSEQVAVYRQRPSLAAVPGTSNHGWGLAVDFCGGLQSAGTPEDRWMHANAGRFGWTHPAWAEPGGGRPEPWHWEFVGMPIPQAARRTGG